MSHNSPFNSTCVCVCVCVCVQTVCADIDLHSGFINMDFVIFYVLVFLTFGSVAAAPSYHGCDTLSGKAMKWCNHSLSHTSRSRALLSFHQLRRAIVLLLCVRACVRAYVCEQLTNLQDSRAVECAHRGREDRSESDTLNPNPNPKPYR